jgi:Uma2 family endonuclease
MSVPLPARRRFTVDEYYRMAETGILAPDERVELIEGEIIQKVTIGPKHAGYVSRLTRLLVLGVGDGALVRIQQPIRLSDLSEPEPDVALVQPRPDDYTAGHPTPGDVFLVIEVADASVEFDRETKGPLYALSGIPECWLVDIPAARVEVYREPSVAGYADMRAYGTGAVLRPATLSGLEVPVAAILS